MNTNRRHFLGGLFAAGVIPSPTWADVGAPAYLSAAAKPEGTYALCGIDQSLNIVFEIPLPARGHAAAAHPLRPEAVAFARRPGTFAMVINCLTGKPKVTIEAPSGRHFYGHGAFSASGDWLYTTENDYEIGRGCVGVWDVARGYVRVAEFDSGGIGPHDVKRLAHSDVLVIANGGIDTHPETGRTKLNIPTMQSNLAYIEGGVVVDSYALPPEMQKNSIRHLAVGTTGTVAFGMQWQADGPVAALVGRHRRGDALELMHATSDAVRTLEGYVGSIAYSADGRTIAATSPRGGVLHLYDTKGMTLERILPITDVCGVAPSAAGLFATAGTGEILGVSKRQTVVRTTRGYKWDNHLVSV
ncbi:DUF1513 domain-containing protein [Sulfitobacter sp. F26204]|uniref:DUF1513 domain-containing protein n=1 Tax=Sulfitobacter sp. F26204 TaxID=2996014 RepID=UPI00225E2FE2|nr:DUF1513 domain-containing protein [Sulfitobacter sp. F26204]MCX7559252.1 DUF1513 domain-containing protein [Sulfitobacter sp. F26204]